MARLFVPVRRAVVLASVLTLGSVGVGAPAFADTPNAFEATLSVSRGTVTVDLGATQYPSAPSSLYIQALSNGCGSADPCWAEQEAALNVSSNFNGSYTLSGLSPHTTYQIDVLASLDGDQASYTGYATTPVDVNGPPSAFPVATVSADGIHATVTAQAEYSQWAIHDGGTLAALRYNVYALIGGKPAKKVLTGVTAGSAHTVSGLPRNTRITFTETDTNSVGESPQSTTSAVVTLAPKAPATFRGVTSTGRTDTQVVWQHPAAGTGHITRYAIRLDHASKTVFSHRYGAKLKDAEITHLQRHTHYVIFLTAYNSYGKHTTIRGVLTTR